MAFISDSDRQRVEAAIEAAETRTTGEFVTVVAQASDDYLYIPTLAAALVVLILSGVALLLPLSAPIPAAWLYGGQVVGFIALTLVFRWMPLRVALVPKAVKHGRAQLLAHRLFLDLGLSSTRDRTGVMLFVSVAEHYVEIIADRGIQQHTDNAVWERIVADFTAAVRAGRVADGFVAAIEACTAVMAEHHPWHAEDENELPNRLVEI